VASVNRAPGGLILGPTVEQAWGSPIAAGLGHVPTTAACQGPRGPDGWTARSARSCETTATTTRSRAKKGKYASVTAVELRLVRLVSCEVLQTPEKVSVGFVLRSQSGSITTTWKGRQGRARRPGQFRHCRSLRFRRPTAQDRPTVPNGLQPLIMMISPCLHTASKRGA
jgi:hypothetical protein